MRKHVLAGMAVLAVPVCAFGQWTQKATNPSYFPYDANWQYPGLALPDPAAINPAYDVPGMPVGWWPRHRTSAVFANERYYVLGGFGLTYDANVDGDANLNTGFGNYWDNRQSGVSIYNPNDDTWQSSKWDGTGPHPQTLYTDLYAVATPMSMGQAVPPPAFILDGQDESGFKLWNLNSAGTSLRYQLYYRDWNTLSPAGPQVSAYIMEVRIGFGVPGTAGATAKVLWQDSDGLPFSGVGDWAGSTTGFWTGLTAADLTALQNGEYYVEIVGDDGSGLPSAGNQEVFLRGQLNHLKSRNHYTATRLFGQAAGAPNIGFDPLASPPQYRVDLNPDFNINWFTRDSTDLDPNYALSMGISMWTDWWQTNELTPAGETITKMYLKQKSTGNVLLTIWDSTVALAGPPVYISENWTDTGNVTYPWWEPLTDATVTIIAAEDIMTEIWTDNASPGGADVLKAKGEPQVLYDPADRPRTDDGFYPGQTNAAAYDRDGDGIKEIYSTSGYPNWGGYIHIYDPAHDTWTQSADHPEWLSGGLVCTYLGPYVLYGDWIYRVTGAFIGVKTSRYNIPEDRWELGNEFLSVDLTGGAWAGPMTFPDGNDYLVATFNAAGNTEIYAYNLTSAAAGNFATEDWAYAHRLVSGTALLRPVGFMFQKKFYVIGTDVEANPNRIWVYDGTGDATQVAGADMPIGAVRASAGIDESCGTVYYGGGQQALNVANTAAIFRTEMYTYNLLGLPAAVRGDANCDGAVDFDDINPFVAALVSETSWKNKVPAACQPGYVCMNDINRDGFVDFDDISPFVRCLVLNGCP